jgi:hypothetical protein
MILNNIPDNLYVLVALIVVGVLHYAAPTASTETLLVALASGLLGLSRSNRSSAGTSLVQTGANAKVVTDTEDKKEN